MAAIKQEWTGYASGAQGGASGWFPQIKETVTKAAKSVKTKKKKQGYNAREDESLGMRTGPESSKKQSMKARRDESYGDWGKR